MTALGIDVSLRRWCLDHLHEAIAQAPLCRAPFPHFVVRSFFPAEVYGAVLEFLPEAKLYEPRAYSRHRTGDGRSTRRSFALSNAALERLDPDRRRFWRTLRSVVGSSELKRATFSKLASALAYRYRIHEEQAVDLPGFATPELFCELEGYSIKPHPDTRRKVVTMQIAFSRDDTQRDLGTEFYRRSLNPLTYFRAPRGFIVARAMAFLPNSAYAFAVLNTLRWKSWHGCSRISASRGERHSLLNVWYERPEHADIDVISDNRELECVLPESVAA